MVVCNVKVDNLVSQASELIGMHYVVDSEINTFYRISPSGTISTFHKCIMHTLPCRQYAETGVAQWNIVEIATQ